MTASSARIGVVSDTHGLVRPEALEALRGVELILHAGDVCGETILDQFRAIAPVHAVRGNCDHGFWADGLPVSEVVEVAGRTLYMLHDLAHLNLSPEAAGFDAVIYGHTHRPAKEVRDGVLYLNPGSIGPRRFDLPISLALLELGADGLSAAFVEIEG